MILKLFVLLSFLHWSIVWASSGDYSNEFRGCYHTCHFNNCSSPKSVRHFEERQTLCEKLLLWSCDDECKYECMWHATTIHLNRGWNVPQFYGKWPFVRFCGLQEPASVIFSALNLLAQISVYKKFRESVPKEWDFYYVWTAYFWVSMNAWIWSIVFHARDTPLTEMMDYFSAFSMVLISLVILLVRILGRGNKGLKICTVASGILFFLYHIWYLATRSFDYGYNMKINVTVGLLNGVGWLWWSWTRRDDRLYLFWCRVTVLGAGATMLLEMMDFDPMLWTFDAHSLWHLSTSILPFYWIKFIEGDCIYLHQRASKFKRSV